MQIGELRERVTLQALVETNDAGDVSDGWSTIATVAARVITQRGSEAFEASRTNASETIRVLIRFRDDITTKARLVWNGQNYNVEAVDRSARHKGELWLTATVIGAL